MHTLRVQTSFASLVLCDLVQGVLSAVLVFAERPLGLGNVHLRTTRWTLVKLSQKDCRDRLAQVPYHLAG